MYISLWENSRWHPDNVSFMQFSTKIDGFEQKDSQGFENSYNSYEQYPLEKFFIFTIYQNYTLALISEIKTKFFATQTCSKQVSRPRVTVISYYTITLCRYQNGMILEENLLVSNCVIDSDLRIQKLPSKDRTSDDGLTWIM